MSSFFYQSAQTLLNQYADRFPLLKITLLLDWQAIEQTLANHKVRYVRDNGGRPAYPLLPMFRAILLGQWHSLSDPELERSLKLLRNRFRRGGLDIRPYVWAYRVDKGFRFGLFCGLSCDQHGRTVARTHRAYSGEWIQKQPENIGTCFQAAGFFID